MYETIFIQGGNLQDGRTQFKNTYLKHLKKKAQMDSIWAFFP